MMNEKSISVWLKYILLAVLLIGIVFLVVEQIYTANTATELETVLFNILQFIFSLVFAWMLSKIVTETQFLESQKKFAIGAFRRIKEIERSLGRTYGYVENMEVNQKEPKTTKISVIKISLMNAQDLVKSSIADWSDIIGDEISIANEIRRLQILRNEKAESETDGRKEKTTDSIQTKKEIEKRIAELSKDLPAELQITIEESIEEDQVDKGVEFLASEWKKNKGLEFLAFWEPDDSFSKNVNEIKPGDTVFVARGFTEKRDGPLLVYDEKDEWIGVVYNLCSDIGCNYDDFISAMEEFYDRKLLPKFFAGIPLTAKVISIYEFDTEFERQHFTLFIDRIPEHPCVLETKSNNK